MTATSPSQAALVIAQMRSARRSGGIEDPDRLLGLDLDQVVLGEDPAPRLDGESPYRRRLRLEREAKEANAQRIAAQEQVDRENRERWQREYAERQERLAEARRQERQRTEDQRVARQAVQVAFEQWQKDHAVERAAILAAFETRFSAAFMKGVRAHDWLIEACHVCKEPFWIPRYQFTNWWNHWSGWPRCHLCNSPALTSRVRHEHPTWNDLRVSHELLAAFRGEGGYARAPELAQRIP